MVPSFHPDLPLPSLTFPGLPLPQLPQQSAPSDLDASITATSKRKRDSDKTAAAAASVGASHLGAAAAASASASNAVSNQNQLGKRNVQSRAAAADTSKAPPFRYSPLTFDHAVFDLAASADAATAASKLKMSKSQILNYFLSNPKDIPFKFRVKKLTANERVAKEALDLLSASTSESGEESSEQSAAESRVNSKRARITTKPPSDKADDEATDSAAAGSGGGNSTSDHESAEAAFIAERRAMKEKRTGKKVQKSQEHATTKAVITLGASGAVSVPVPHPVVAHSRVALEGRNGSGSAKSASAASRGKRISESLAKTGRPLDSEPLSKGSAAAIAYSKAHSKHKGKHATATYSASTHGGLHDPLAASAGSASAAPPVLARADTATASQAVPSVSLATEAASASVAPPIPNSGSTITVTDQDLLKIFVDRVIANKQAGRDSGIPPETFFLPPGISPVGFHQAQALEAQLKQMFSTQSTTTSTFNPHLTASAAGASSATPFPVPPLPLQQILPQQAPQLDYSHIAMMQAQQRAAAIAATTFSHSGSAAAAASSNQPQMDPQQQLAREIFFSLLQRDLASRAAAATPPLPTTVAWPMPQVQVQPVVPPQNYAQYQYPMQHHQLNSPQAALHQLRAYELLARTLQQQPSGSAAGAAYPVQPQLTPQRPIPPVPVFSANPQQHQLAAAGSQLPPVEQPTASANAQTAVLELLLRLAAQQNAGRL
jgi:hypothetical protein